MENNLLKSLVAIGTVFIMIGCDGGSSSPSETEGVVSTDVPITDTSGTEDTSRSDTSGTDTNSSDVQEEAQDAIDGPASKISQELINTLAHMGNEERLAYDVYNALYVKYGKKTFTNIATNGEYKHISLVQELIQKYKLSDNVNFTNVDLPALGYMNTAIEDMVPGVYDISEIQDLYDDLMKMATNLTEALKVGCRVEVIDIIDLDRDIALAQAEDAEDIATVFKTLRSGSYKHYWAFDRALQNQGGCCPTALEILGGTECPDYPQ